MTPVRLDPASPRSRVKHSSTEPLRSLSLFFCDDQRLIMLNDKPCAGQYVCSGFERQFLAHFRLYLAARQGSTIIFNAMVYG